MAKTIPVRITKSRSKKNAKLTLGITLTWDPTDPESDTRAQSAMKQLFGMMTPEELARLHDSYRAAADKFIAAQQPKMSS